MERKQIGLGVLLILSSSLLQLGCIEPSMLSNEDEKKEAQPSNKGNENDEKLRQAIREFLQDKELELAKDTKIKIDVKNIKAMELDESRVKVNDGPWRKEGTFLLAVDKTTYAVRFQISFRQVEEKFAFFDFKADEVAKQ